MNRFLKFKVTLEKLGFYLIVVKSADIESADQLWNPQCGSQLVVTSPRFFMSLVQLKTV